MKLGLVAFANNSGLGNQTRRLTYMLQPYRLLVINSQSFSKNSKQHFEWYKGFNGYLVDGFPSDKEINKFLQGLTHVFVCENPMNFYLLRRAKQLNIKVYIQSNYEFCDHLNNPALALPHKFLMPSYWHLETMKRKFGEDNVVYLPPNISTSEFADARKVNLERTGKRRYLHIVGTLAVEDRNGTLDLIEAVKKCKTEFLELTIRSQHELPQNYLVDDRRIKYVIEDIAEPVDMYKDFDALILPRRYGGLSLTTNEALMSAMPVIMPNISPNNQLLPKQWLVEAEKTHEVFTRTFIDVYKTDTDKLAEKIDEFTHKTDEELQTEKLDALELAFNQFSNSVLSDKYNQLW